MKKCWLFIIVALAGTAHSPCFGADEIERDDAYEVSFGLPITTYIQLKDAMVLFRTDPILPTVQTNVQLKVVKFLEAGCKKVGSTSSTSHKHIKPFEDELSKFKQALSANNSPTSSPTPSPKSIGSPTVVAIASPKSTPE